MPKHFVAYGGEPPHYYLIYGVYDNNKDAESDAKKLDDLIVQGQIINIDNDISERCLRAEKKIEKIQELLTRSEKTGDNFNVYLMKKILNEDTS